MPTPPLDRVVVVGCSCSGKTTFAKALSKQLGHPHIELDALHWLPNWESVPHTAFRLRVLEATTPEHWIIDGNYTLIQDITWDCATTVIWLNYPFHIVAKRALARTIRRIIKREVLFSGNRESFRKSFLSRDSILLWVLKSYKQRKKTYGPLFADPPDNKTYIQLRHPNKTHQFLTRLQEQP